MGAMANLLIGIMIAILPLYTKVAEGDVSRLSKDNLLLMFFGLMCVILPQKVRNLPPSLWVAVGYGLISIVWNQINPGSIPVMLQSFYLCLGILFFVAFFERHTQDGQELILDGMTIGCLAQSIIVICTYLGIPVYEIVVGALNPDMTVMGSPENGVGSLGNQNLLAAYVGITAISLLRKNTLYLLPLPIIALLVADSMMGWGTMLAGVVYASNLLSKRTLYLSSMAVMAILLFTGMAGMDTYRITYWWMMLSRLGPIEWLFGNGPGWFYLNPIMAREGKWLLQEHNELISAIHVFGIIGLGLLAQTFWKFINAPDSKSLFPAILFAGFCNSYGHFTLHQSSTALIIIVSAAICLAQEGKHVFSLER
jgi:hypothetical protein